MVRLRTLSWGMFTVLITLFFGLMGCDQPRFKAASYTSKRTTEPTTTGLSTEVTTEDGDVYEVDYVPAGDLDLLEQLKNERSVTYSTNLAESIEQATVTKEKTSAQGGVRLNIDFKIANEQTPLHFEVDTSEQNLNQKVSLKAKSNDNFQLDLECPEEDCQRYVLNLKEVNNLGHTIRETGGVYTETETEVRAFIEPQDEPASREVEAVKDELLQNPTVIRKKVTIDGGKSYTELEVKTADRQNTLVKVSFKNRDTTSSPPRPADKVEVYSPAATNSPSTDSQTHALPAKASLVGLNPNSGDAALDLDLDGMKSRLYIDAPESTKKAKHTPLSRWERRQRQNSDTSTQDSQTSDTPAPEEINKVPLQSSNPRVIDDSELLSRYANAVIPLEAGLGVPLDFSLAATKQIENYRDLPEVKEYIEYWQGVKKHRGCKGVTYYDRSNAQEFVSHVPPVAKYMTTALNLIDAPVSIAYVMAVESAFYKSKSKDFYNPNIVTVSAKDLRSSDAAGPFQMLTSTAFHVLAINSDLLNQLGLEGLKVYYTTDFERKKFGSQSVNYRYSRLKNNKKYPDSYISQEDYNKLKRALLANDARNNLFSATLLTGLYGKELMHHTNKKPWQPKDPALFPIAYRVGPGEFQDYLENACSSLEGAESTQCLKDSKVDLEFLKRHKNKNPSFRDVVKYRMASCTGLDYALAVLSIGFIGSTPTEYGFVRSQKPRLIEVNNSALIGNEMWAANFGLDVHSASKKMQ